MAIILAIVLSITSVGFFMFQIKKDLVQPIVIFMFIYYIIGHIFRLLILWIFPGDLANFSFRDLTWDSEIAAATSLISLLALFSIIFGHKLANRFPTIRIATNPLKPKNPNQIALITLLLCSLLYYWFFNDVRATSDTIRSGASGIPFSFVSLLVLFTLEVAVKKKSAWLLRLSFLGTIVITVRGLMNAWKSSVINVFIFWLMFQYLRYGSVKLKKASIAVVILLVVLLVVVYPFVSTLRYYSVISETITLGDLVSASFKKVDFVGTFLSGLRYLSARFQYFDEEYTVVAMTEDERNLYRREVVNPLFATFSFMFPRAIFSEKPIITTGRANAVHVALIPRSIYTNVAISLVGDLYLRTGFFGTIFWAALYGFILGVFYKGFKSGNIRPYFYFWMLMRLNFSEGDMFAKISGLVMDLVILAFLFFLLDFLLDRVNYFKAGFHR